jgi:molybdopterin converting factor small subunit
MVRNKGARVIVSLFGKLGDLIGREVSLDLPHPAPTVGEVRKALADAYPRAASDLLSPRVRACVGDIMVDDRHPLAPGDEVSLLPPVSGG